MIKAMTIKIDRDPSIPHVFNVFELFNVFNAFNGSAGPLNFYS